MLLTAQNPPRHVPEPTVVEPTVARPAARSDRAREAAEYAAFAVLVLGAGWVERHGAGLEGFWSVAPGLLATLPLIVVSRGWRLPLPWLLVAAALPVSIIATAALAPGGWAGAERSAAYGYGSLTFVALAAFARTSARRLAAAVALALLALDQFAQSWLAWWGSQDPTRMLTGTFNWHNQYGAFAAAGVVLCSALALTAPARRVRALAVFVGSILATGLLASASRASVLAAAAACAVALLLAMRSVGVARATSRAAVVAGASLAVGLFLRSPLFFPQWSWPWTPLVGRSVADSASGSSSYQPLSGNASARLSYWQSGVDMATDHPLVGTGLSTFGDASRWSMPLGVRRSVDPHNELVRAGAEGGLVGGLPLALVLVLALALAALHLRAWWRQPASAITDPAALASLLAAAVLVTHALVDFDWSYPTLAMAAGWCLAVAAAAIPVLAPASSRAVAAGALVITLLASMAGSGVAARSRNALVESATSATDATRAQQALRAAWQPVAPDHRLPAMAVTLAWRDAQPAPEWALGALGPRAAVDSIAAVTLSRAEFSRGDRGAGLERLRQLARRDPVRAPDLVLAYADLLARDGRRAQAADVAVQLLTAMKAADVPVEATSSVATEFARLTGVDVRTRTVAP